MQKTREYNLSRQDGFGLYGHVNAGRKVSSIHVTFNTFLCLIKVPDRWHTNLLASWYWTIKLVHK